MNDSDAADRTTRRGPNQRGHAPGAKPRVSVDSFRRDPMYPQVERAVAAILASSKVVAPVDVIVQLGWLSTADLENWRFGRVPYLERVIRCNLTRLSRFLRILGFHCHELNLTASQTAYVKWARAGRQRCASPRPAILRSSESMRAISSGPARARFIHHVQGRSSHERSHADSSSSTSVS